MLSKTIIQISLFFICLLHVVTSTAQDNYSYCSLKPVSKDKKASHKVAKDSTIKVFVFYSPDCPIRKTLVLHLNKIHKQYQSTPVDFHIVIPSSLHYSKKDLENKTGYIIDRFQGVDVDEEPDIDLLKQCYDYYSKRIKDLC